MVAGLLLGIGFFTIMSAAMQPRRTTPVYDPPVLAGQQLWGACAGGFYARHGDTIVLTSTGHCTSEGTVAYDPDGTTVRGVFGPAARDASCPYPVHTCASSDLNYLVVAPDRIPWGHLNVVDWARPATGSSRRARGRSPAPTSRSVTGSRSTAATSTAAERWLRRARTSTPRPRTGPSS